MTRPRQYGDQNEKLIDWLDARAEAAEKERDQWERAARAAAESEDAAEWERNEARSQERTWREIADDQSDRAIAAESRAASLEEVLGELVEAAERFSTEADYSVSVSTEEDFAAALKSARALSRSSSPDTSETGGSG